MICPTLARFGVRGVVGGCEAGCVLAARRQAVTKLLVTLAVVVGFFVVFAAVIVWIDSMGNWW